jgi:hypothetical protein
VPYNEANIPVVTHIKCKMVGKNQAPAVVSQEKKSKGMGNIVVIWA